MAVLVIDKLKPKSGGFAIADAEDIEYQGERISTILSRLSKQITDIEEEPERITFSTYLEFPTTGDPNTLYIDTSAGEDKIYRWDDEKIRYVLLSGIKNADVFILDGTV